MEAGPGSEIELSNSTREGPGTTVTLSPKPEHFRLAEQPELLEGIIEEHADFFADSDPPTERTPART